MANWPYYWQYQQKAEPLVATIEAPFDWFVEPADVVQPLHQQIFISGATQEHLEPTHYVEQNLDWIVEPSDVVQPLHQTDTGYITNDHLEPTYYVEQNLDWIVQHPTPPLPLHQTDTGFFAFWPEPITTVARVVTLGGVTISSTTIVLTG